MSSNRKCTTANKGDLRQDERDALDNLECFVPHGPIEQGRRASTILVGAGIVNLVTALALHRKGFNVRVFEARPDPRRNLPWPSFGCTFSGHDARIFSLTEARQHHSREGAAPGTSSYSRSIADEGWLCRVPEDLEPSDRAWILEHERIPGWLLKQYEDDILRFNVESARLWRDIQKKHPNVLSDTVIRNGLIRTYPTEEKLIGARARELSLDGAARVLTGEQLLLEIPSLAEPVRSGEIFGAMSVDGFSVNVHEFGCSLIEMLEENGVVFNFDQAITCIARNADGGVRGLECGKDIHVAGNYVISPGAYGYDLLSGLHSEGCVAGVVGPWVVIPNTPPQLQIPLKISRSGFGAPGPSEGANVIPATDKDGNEVLYISCGHGFVGSRPADVSLPLLDRLKEIARDTARRYFPDKYATAINEGLDLNERICVRPWTPSGLGLFETVPTDQGGALILATGHNTGGFAQAPAVAKAVLSTLSGELHPMQKLYHPLRTRHFLQSLTAIDEPADA